MKNTKPITEDQLAATIARFFGFDFRQQAQGAAKPILGLMVH